MSVTRYRRGRTGNFHLVSNIPNMTHEEMQQRVLLVGPNNFRIMFDLESGDIFSTDCVWCAHRPGFRIPENVRNLFDGLEGKRLSELSADGRLQRVLDFIEENQDQLRPVEESDIYHHDSTLDVYRPMWQPNSFPANPNDMKYLPIGTKVKIMLPEKTSIHEILRSWASEDGSTVYEINLDVNSGPLEHMGNFFTGNRRYVQIKSSDLLPTDEHGMVQTRTIPHSYWRDADYALFGIALAVIGNVVIQAPVSPSILGSLPFLAVEMNKRSLWVNWLTALGFQFNAFTGMTITHLDRNYRLAGGTTGAVAVAGQYLNTGLRFGYYRMGGLGYLSLPAVAAVTILAVNAPAIWKAGWGLWSGDISLNNGEMNFQPTNSAMVNEGLSTFGDAAVTLAGNVQRTVNATWHTGVDAARTVYGHLREGGETLLTDMKNLGDVTIDAGKEWAEDAGQIPGKFAKGLGEGALSANTRSSLANWMRGGSATILFVAAAVVGLSVYDKAN